LLKTVENRNISQGAEPEKVPVLIADTVYFRLLIDVKKIPDSPGGR